MKRKLSALIVLFLALSFMIPILAVNMSENRPMNIDENQVTQNGELISVPQKASKETLELAKSVVWQLEQKVVFTLGLGTFTLDQLYNAAKYAVEDTRLLETKPDASIALIEVYEEIMSESEEYDFEAYYSFGKENQQRLRAGLPPEEFDDNITCGRDLLGMRETIEALLAVDAYSALLDKAQFNRMMSNFERFAIMIYEAQAKIYDDAVPETLYEKYLNYYIPPQ